MTSHSEDIDKALEAAIDALQPIVSADGTIQPQHSIEAALQQARTVVALEELKYQELITLHQSGDGNVFR